MSESSDSTTNFQWESSDCSCGGSRGCRFCGRLRKVDRGSENAAEIPGAKRKRHGSGGGPTRSPKVVCSRPSTSVQTPPRNASPALSGQDTSGAIPDPPDLNNNQVAHTTQHAQINETAVEVDDPVTVGARTRRKCRGSGPGRRPPKVVGTRTNAHFQCPKCPSILSTAFNLKIHLEQHGKTGLKFNCTYCDYASNRDDYMRNHMDAHVNSVNNASLPSSPSFGNTSPATASSNYGTNGAPPETLTPEDYEKLISGNPKFTYMTVTTSGEPLPVETSFKCWHCPYATTKYAFLVTHRQGHEVKSKYGCNQCTYSAGSIQELNNHKLAHTVQHQQVNETTNGQLIPFRGETSRSPASPSPSPSSASTVSTLSVHESRGGSGQFFISNIRITNIMAKNQEPTVADVSTHGILKLKGNSEEGKSSYILAVMLGLGYDLVLDHRDETTSICGRNLHNAISDGQDFGSVELTVSLRAFPQLQKDFGSQIKFSRRIERRNPLLANVITITSADPRPQFQQVRPKMFTGRELTKFLRQLKLSPERLRLMLLDEENVKYFMDNTHLWYVLFEAAVEESEMHAMNETQFLLEILDGKEKLQRERWEWFQSRLGWRPVDSEKIRQVIEEEWTNHRKCTTELNQLANERKDLEQKLANYAQQSRDSVLGYIQKMRTVFHKFLDPLNYHGEIMVCERSRSLAICMWNADSKEVRPTTLEGVDRMWRNMANGNRRIAVIGLYLALWEISCYLGIVAADAFSCTKDNFRVPPEALPVLLDLVNRKCLEQKQCIVSLPPEY